MFHKHGGDVYSYQNIEDFSANINFRGMPERVRNAALAAVDASLHYPDPDSRALRNALVKREEKYGISKDEILCGNGAAELMFSLAMAKQPKYALIAVPSFYEYEQALDTVGTSINRVFLREEDDFQVGKAFLDQVRYASKNDMVILGNPNNPTGKVIETSVLEKLIYLCKEKGLTLVLDESFMDFLSEEDRKRTRSGLEFVEEYPNVFVIQSFTKMFAMPGLRLGYGICSDLSLITKMRSLLQPWNVSVPAQMAGTAAAEETEFVRETVCMNAENRKIQTEILRNAGYKVFDSTTNYLMFQGPVGVDKYCVEHGFLIRDCSNFPGLGKGFYRICIRSREENERLANVLIDAYQVLACQ